MIKASVEELKEILVFKDIDIELLEILREKAFKISIKKGETVFAEKEKIRIIYMVLKGKMTMYRYTEEGQKRVVYILNKGEMINEVIFDYKPASISCEGFEDSELVCFYREDFLAIMEKNFKLTKNIVDSMSKKIRRLYRQLKNTVPIKMDKKVAAKLWMLSRDFGVEIEEGILIDLNITVTYIADMLGSSRETISRSLKVLENKGLIFYKNKKIVARSKEELSKYFRGI